MLGVWTTEGIPEAEQFAYWRDAVCDAFVPLEPEGRPERFSGRIESFHGQDLQVSSVAAEGHPVNLTRRGVHRQGNTYFFANLLLYGSVFVEQFGVGARVEPGDIYLLDTASPFAVQFASRFKILCVTLDEAMLRPRLGSGGRLSSPVIRGNRGAGQLTAQYIRNVIAPDPVAVLDVQDLAAVHLSSLLVRAASGEAEAEGEEGLARSNRGRASLERIKGFVDAHLAEPGLSVQGVCSALNMSRSHLYGVMAEAGETFSGYLRDRRLDECRRSILAAPDKTIAEIAYAWGFQDQSSFTRMFKARFGVTPRQARSG
ncbi:transcriptional regulator, AraC family [Tistlia consotensis]|uniref:Transcriptional regulator, AraC family n=1 Tax=Tistlia consotensis USBA 355 TaxID=560819 RepID=A0A1Y6B6R3_9PROT|nr:helix-turn-helix domain-containing protein [Tistlia consotensis]SME91151.1 transcriptional regulator, AraC family [Tistlia consotensis USBA 355]SNR27163.1 transcriptional regulator, AraC family [Tistlia consotensis]